MNDKKSGKLCNSHWRRKINLVEAVIIAERAQVGGGAAVNEILVVISRTKVRIALHTTTTLEELHGLCKKSPLIFLAA